MLFSDGQINHNGNKALADLIFKEIRPKLDNNISRMETFKFHLEKEVDNFLLDNPDFNSYIIDLKKMKEEKNIKGKIGYVIMNCNPFTLGHRYLIEKALEIVNYLYIFILSEDVSLFPFKDRLKLVKSGLEDLKNKICVLPVSRWIATIINEENDDEIISAKNIRNIIKLSIGEYPSEEDIEKLKKLVPFTTLEYLVSNWNIIKNKLL